MSAHTRLMTSALAGLVALGLAACGSDPEPASSPAPSSPQSSSPSTPSMPSSPGASSAIGAGTGTASPSVSPDAWKTAIATAEKHAGGTAYELDDQDDDGTWEVDVAVGNRSVEVTVSADGTSVVGTDDTNDTDDLDDEDRRGLEAARITLADAITTALGEVDGELDDAELEDDNGTFVWEVTIDEQAHEAEVYVDVRSGDVVRVDRG